MSACDASPPQPPLGGDGALRSGDRRKVRVLPDQLVDQIAAGEVVERPASVVKELVENALDAGATRVHVEIGAGGSELVRVTDDGFGMDCEDAEMALLRHATSKVRTIEELVRIASFGFRGEALPSIASVSRFKLRTRVEGAAEGTEIESDGGAERTIRPSGGATGTSVEVRELFFNVPARRKFLRSTGTESAHVTEVVESAALAEPGVAFVLSRDGRVVREWLRASTREERVGDALRGEQLATCRGARGPLHVEAFLARPERARPGAGGLHVFVNGRPVRDRPLARALAHAYGSVLEPGRYPVGVLYLDLPPEHVDVNVHPQKAEVRFAEGRAVAEAVYHCIHEPLGRAFNLPSDRARFGKRPELWAPPPPPAAGAWVFPDTTASGGAAGDESPLPPSAGPAGAPLSADGSLDPRPYPLASELARAPQRELTYRGLRFVAQVRRMFLLCEGDDGLYIVDQHAAAERVTFHRLRSAFVERRVARQALLFPALVDVPAAEVALVEEAADEVAAAGLDVRVVGPQTLAVHAVPLLLARVAPERLVRDICGELSRAGTRAFSDAIDLALATMACHGSVRAGDAVSPEEARSLLEQLDEVDFAGHCPHGRPIVMRLGWPELEARVGRR